MQIGVDVGGTNTDAVLMSGRDVVDGYKSATTEEPGLGIINAVSKILEKNKTNSKDIESVMIGTTQFTNAFVEKCVTNKNIFKPKCCRDLLMLLMEYLSGQKY